MKTIKTLKFPGDTEAREIYDEKARESIGDLSSLNTSDKTNLVNAINEIKTNSLTGETDPTVPAWAKEPNKPTYTASEVGADASGTAASAINTHDQYNASHTDIRAVLNQLSENKMEKAEFTTNVGGLIPSKNLLDGVFEWGRIGQDGYNYDKDNPITGSFRTKNYIPVTGGRTIALYYARAQWNGNDAGLTMNIAQYDANKVVINGRENFIPYAANQKTFNLNENTVYIKIARPSSTTVITDSLDEIEIGVYYIEDFVSEFIPYEPVAVDRLLLDPRKIATSLYGKKIVYDGDSICESRTTGTAVNGGGYAKIIENLTGCQTINQAVGGARLCANSEKHSVVNNLPNLPTDGDLYCFQGGINDYWADTHIGTCSSTDYTGTLDTSTICGALETIFRYCLTNFIGKPVCFVITHKVKNTGHSENTNGDTFRDYRDAMVEVCEKYSIPYYDAFMESGLNGMIAEQSNTYLNAGAGGTEGDGTHPNEEGYKRYYVPQLIQLFERIMPI